VQLVSEISNLCGPDATLQTDRRTDDMQSQDCALPYSALRGKNTIGKIVDTVVIIIAFNALTVLTGKRAGYLLENPWNGS